MVVDFQQASNDRLDPSTCHSNTYLVIFLFILFHQKFLFKS
jgi:hypothetical protein